MFKRHALVKQQIDAGPSVTTNNENTYESNDGVENYNATEEFSAPMDDPHLIQEQLQAEWEAKTRLNEFYNFTFEKPLLVGRSSSSPTSKSGTKEPSAPHTNNNNNNNNNNNSNISRELMNLLLPPKTWKDPETQERWQRLVSLVPSTRERVRQLQETFDLLMIENQARQYPICPVRGKFFLQLFDEIIRQVACDCPERAVLLVRVRDEIRLRIETYQTLYHNSNTYGCKRAIDAETGIIEREEQIKALEKEQKQLQQKKNELEHKMMFLQNQLDKKQIKRNEGHEATIRFLTNQYQQLETFLKELQEDDNLHV